MTTTSTIRRLIASLTQPRDQAAIGQPVPKRLLLALQCAVAGIEQDQFFAGIDRVGMKGCS